MFFFHLRLEEYTCILNFFSEPKFFPKVSQKPPPFSIEGKILGIFVKYLG